MNEKKQDCVDGILKALVYAHDVKGGAEVALCTFVLYKRELAPIVVYTKFDCERIVNGGFIIGIAGPVGPVGPFSPCGPTGPPEGPALPWGPVGPR